MEFYTLLVALFGQLFEDIAFERSGVYNIIIGLLGVPHRKTVVVTRCDTDIFCTRVLYGFNPVVGIEIGRIEAGGRFSILFCIQT